MLETKKEQTEAIEKLISILSVAGLTQRIAAICTVNSYDHTKAGNEASAEAWQNAAEAVLEASYKCGV